MKAVLALLVVLSLWSACEAYVHFHGNSVWRVRIETEEQRQFIESMNLDVWTRDGSLVLGLNDVMVDDMQKRILTRKGIKYDIFIEDVEQRITEEREYHMRIQNEEPLDFYDAYHNYTAIVAYYQTLASTYPTLAKYVPSIGETLEKKSIPAIHITGGTSTNKKKIFFNGGQHAREWIGPATVTYIVEQLLAQYNTDPAVKRLVDGIEFVVVPLVNLDGYAFTWTSNRLWRKNRRLNQGGSYGVDLNRNWDDHWGGNGSSGTPTSDTYRGTAPFSEPESKATADYYLKTGPFKGAIDYHSYSQLVLRPYGWTNTAAPNEAVGKLVGDNIAAAIRATSGLSYTSQPSYQLYYTAGTASDWCYAAGKAPLSYTIELRDTGTYGFQLPANQIRPTGQENWNAFKYFANYILANVTL